MTIISSKRRGTGQRGSIAHVSVSPLSTSNDVDSSTANCAYSVGSPGSREISGSPPAFAGNGLVNSCASLVAPSNTSNYFGRMPSSSAAGSEAGQTRDSLTMDIAHWDSHEITCLSPKSKTTLLRTPEAIEAMLYNSGRYVELCSFPR